MLLSVALLFNKYLAFVVKTSAKTYSIYSMSNQLTDINLVHVASFVVAVHI